MTGRGTGDVAATLLAGLEALDAARRESSGGPVLDEVGQALSFRAGVAGGWT